MRSARWRSSSSISRTARASAASPARCSALATSATSTTRCCSAVWQLPKWRWRWRTSRTRKAACRRRWIISSPRTAAPRNRRRSKDFLSPLLRRPYPLVCLQCAGDEVRNRLERRLGRFALWRMAGARQQGNFDRAIALRLRHLDLLHGAVLIVLALHDQDRHANISQEFRDIPFAEFRIEPCVIPAHECIVDVGMPARKPRTQVARGIGFLRLSDGGQARFLSEEMRCDEHEAADPMVLMTARVDRRD